MEITLNGDQREVEAGHRVGDLVRELGRDPDRPGVAVAVNATVLRRDEWEDRALREGDEVEIVTAVQGGTGPQR
jgi:sulfur carrier protein